VALPQGQVFALKDSLDAVGQRAYIFTDVSDDVASVGVIQASGALGRPEAPFVLVVALANYERGHNPRQHRDCSVEDFPQHLHGI
jgi:hypothetical protein